ncbi:unnamed protein product, partial [Laminaria digitata]
GEGGVCDAAAVAAAASAAAATAATVLCFLFPLANEPCRGGQGVYGTVAGAVVLQGYWAPPRVFRGTFCFCCCFCCCCCCVPGEVETVLMMAPAAAGDGEKLRMYRILFYFLLWHFCLGAI